MDFSRARDGAAGATASRTEARAVGEAARPKASRPSVKGAKRGSASKANCSSRPVDRGAIDRERVVAESLEAEDLARTRAKSPAQKRADREARAAGPAWKRAAAESRQAARKKAASGADATGSRDRRAAAAQVGVAKARESASGKAERRKVQQKPASGGNLATAITAGLVDAAAAVVEFVRKPHSKTFKRALVALVCLVVAAAFIYPSASDYYIAIRNNDKAQAEYAALQDYHNTLKDQVDYMESDQGIEDRARDQYGMVKGGENNYNIDNLDSESSFDKNPTDIGITPKGSISAPEKWYTPFLDPFFGYEG